MDVVLADALTRKAAAIIDPAVRVQLFHSIIVGLPREELREALGVLIERAGLRDTHAGVALLSLQQAIALLPDADRILYTGSVPPPEADAKPEHHVVDPDAPDAPPRDEENGVRLPNYGFGRTPSLGERKSLARRPDRKTLEKVLRDPHPDVIALLLQNPRLTEDDVVRMCARRPGVPEVLVRVFASTRWSIRPAVRRALAMNPATPDTLVAAVVPLLGPDELRLIAQDERVLPSVRRRCLEILTRLSPPEGDASPSIH